MDTDREVFWDTNMTSAAFLGCPVGVDLDYRPSGFCRLEGQNIQEVSPSGVQYGLGEMSVPYHASDIEVFGIDDTILPNIAVGQLEQEVFTLAGYFFMGSGNKQASFVSSARPLDFGREPALPLGKQGFGFPEILRRIDGAAVGIGNDVAKAQIDANHGAGFRKIFTGNMLAGKRDKPLAGFRFPERNRLDVALDGSGQKQPEPAYAGDNEASALELPSGLLKGKGVIAVTALEPGEPGFALSGSVSGKESVEGLPDPLDNILEDLGANGGELGELLLEPGKLVLLIHGGHGTPLLGIDEDALLKA
jgi:hypothetical protein